MDVRQHRFDPTDVFSPRYAVEAEALDLRVREKEPPVSTLDAAVRGGAIACGALLLLLLVLLVPLPNGLSVDTAVLVGLNRLAAAMPLHQLQWEIVNNEVPQLLLAAGVVMLWSRRTQRKWSRDLALLAFGAAIVTYFFSRTIQHFVGRPRPIVDVTLVPVMDPETVERVRDSFTRLGSLPSDHAALYAIAVLVAFAVNRRAGFVVLAIAAWATLYRLAAGFHYPADVVVGALIGTAVAVVVLKFFDVLRPRLIEVHRQFRKRPVLMNGLGFAVMAEFGFSLPITKSLFRAMFHVHLFH